ncbi:MAG: hypothetical protein ABTR07_16065 [Candidatus Competibacter denitrificans]
MNRRRNPIAAAPILRKGGAHQKPKTAERVKARLQVKQEAATWQASSTRCRQEPVPAY